MNVIEIFKTEWIQKAAQYVQNPSKMMELVEKAIKYVIEHGLDDAIDSVKLLGAYIKAIANGSYTDYSKAKLALAVAALIYLVTPVDIVPDFIPVVGLLDDAAVLGFAIKQMKEELDKFKAANANENENEDENEDENEGEDENEDENENEDEEFEEVVDVDAVAND